MGRAQQLRSPLAEDRCNFIGVFLRNKSIEPSLHFQERGVEWPLATIVRLQVKSVARSGLHGRRRRQQIRGRESPQLCGEEECPDSLTEANKKFAPAELGEIRRHEIKRDANRRIRQLSLALNVAGRMNLPGDYFFAFSDLAFISACCASVFLPRAE